MVLLGSLCRAQTPAATLSGSVHGPQLTGLEGVTIAIESSDRKVTRNAVTDARGRFSFGGLAAGAYAIRAAMSGFAPWALDVEVFAEEDAEIDIGLEPASAPANPEAVRRAIEKQQLQRDTSAATDTVGRRELLSLPLGDDPLALSPKPPACPSM